MGRKSHGNEDRKILIVDDDEGILEAFRAMFENTPYDISTSLGTGVLTTISRSSLPDLIILDVLLSGQDGRDICRTLKSDPKTKHIPIVMISAHPKAEKSTLEAGADDYLKKPFEIDELMKKIEKFLKEK